MLKNKYYYGTRKYLLSVLPNPNSTYGTTTGSGTYSYNTSVLISASPKNKDYAFLLWKEGETTTNPRTVTVTQNTTYNALFYKIPTGELRIVDSALNLYTYDEYAGLSEPPPAIGVALNDGEDWLVYYKQYIGTNGEGITGCRLTDEQSLPSDVFTPLTPAELLYPHSGLSASNVYKMHAGSGYAAYLASELKDGGLTWYIPNLYELSQIFSKAFDSRSDAHDSFESHFSLASCSEIRLNSNSIGHSHWTCDIGNGASLTLGEILPFRVYLSSRSNTFWYASSGNYTRPNNYNYVRPVARIHIIQINITYNSNGATGGSVPSALTVRKGDLSVIQNSGNLSKTRYTFTGWNTAADGSGTTYSPGTGIHFTADTTLYAQWKPNKVMIGFKCVSNSSEPIVLTYPSGETLSAHNLVNKNPSFVSIRQDNDLVIKDPTDLYNVIGDGSYHGWRGTQSVLSTNPKNNNASYYVLVYNTDFDDSFYGVKIRIKNENTIISETVVANLYSGTPVSVTVDNYGTCSVTKFVKFDVDLVKDYSVEVELLKNPTYTITVLADPTAGGSVSGGGTVSYDTTTLISTTPNTGYNFVQWSDGWRQLTRNITVIESKTYIAQYTAAEPPFTVTFDLNGHGSGSAPAALVLDSTTGYYVTKPTDPTDSNYTFNGWFTSSECTGQRWSFTNDEVKSNTLLYAGWVLNTSAEATVRIFTSHPSERYVIGKIYSEDPDTPIQDTNVLQRGRSCLSCTVDENNIWGNPRVHECSSDKLSAKYRIGSRCIFKLYLDTLSDYYDFVGLSINKINGGKLLQALGIRNFDMPYCTALTGSTPLTQVSCYYYEFSVDEAGTYAITPLFRAKTS